MMINCCCCRIRTRGEKRRERLERGKRRRGDTQESERREKTRPSGLNCRCAAAVNQYLNALQQQI